MTRNGILCESDGRRVYFDPKFAGSKEVNFVSHAHTDHLPTKNGGMILSSSETMAIAKLRGLEINNYVDKIENMSLVDTGHILGSKGLLIDEIFYTGDICTRERGFLKGASIPKCKTLITECTFGLPEFVFPRLEDIKKFVNEIISSLYSRGVPVLLLGYQLGKAQTITQLFGHWEPIYFHDSVKSMNDLHKQLGVKLPEGLGHTEAEKAGLLDKKPWIMVAPMMSAKNHFIRRMKEDYGAVSIGFTGWAKSNRFSFWRNTDYSVPLSDHCDFNELVTLVKRSGAEKIYTIHGFVEEFADRLSKMGFDAQPLRQGSLDNFF